MKDRVRKIIQIAVAQTENTDDGYLNITVVALCDDGSTWRMINEKNGWLKFPPIPQPLSMSEIDELEMLMAKDRRESLNEDEKEELKHLAMQAALRN